MMYDFLIRHLILKPTHGVGDRTWKTLFYALDIDKLTLFKKFSS